MGAPFDQAIQELDAVALMVDMPEHSLIRGQVGTAVASLTPGVFEIEFADEEGRNYAQLAIEESKLMVLHYQPQ